MPQIKFFSILLYASFITLIIIFIFFGGLKLIVPSFINFTLPSYSFTILTVFVVIIVSFFCAKSNHYSIIHSALSGLFAGLFLGIVALWLGILGFYMVIGITGFMMSDVPKTTGETHLLLFSLILLTTLSGLIGGLLARLYQKVSKK